jgi:hypothetical protein
MLSITVPLPCHSKKQPSSLLKLSEAEGCFIGIHRCVDRNTLSGLLVTRPSEACESAKLSGTKTSQAVGSTNY